MRGLAALIFMILIAIPVGAYSTTLTPEQMQAAIAYGNELSASGRVVEGAFVARGTEWARNLPADEGYVVWLTPFAYVVKEQAIKGTLPADIPKMLDWLRQRATVTVVFTIPERRVGKALRILVQTGSNTVRPDRTNMSYEKYSEKTQRWTYNVGAEFANTETFSPSGTARVVVGWPDKSRTVEFDLDAMR